MSYRETRQALRDGCAFQGFAVPSLFEPAGFDGPLRPLNRTMFDEAARQGSSVRMTGRYREEDLDKFRRALAGALPLPGG